jgi:hypothetical protein
MIRFLDWGRNDSSLGTILCTTNGFQFVYSVAGPLLVQPLSQNRVLLDFSYLSSSPHSRGAGPSAYGT